MTTIITTALAILGTIASAVVSGHYHRRAAVHTEHIAHGEAIRRDRLDAVKALATAVSAHRTAMWKRGDAKLKGAAPEEQWELRSLSHDTRSAITGPLIALRILIMDAAVREAADSMVTLTYALRNADTDTDTLTAAREAAKVAHDDFIDVAAAYLTA